MRLHQVVRAIKSTKMSENPLKKQKLDAINNVLLSHSNGKPYRAGHRIPPNLMPGKKGKIKRKYVQKLHDPTVPLGVLLLEIKQLFKKYELTEKQTFIDINKILNSEELLAKYNRDVESVRILKLTSNGDGLGLIPHAEIEDGFQAIVVPFAYPGEVVDVRIFRTHPSHCEADLLKVVESAESFRNDSLINCKYFGKCSGCQYQNIEYSKQLELKRDTIVNAYKYFAPILEEKGLVSEIGKTFGSPLQYRYRTKLTPHFDMPRGKFNPETLPRPALGFGAKGRPQWRQEAEGGNKSVIDIEECPIGTDILNMGYKNERVQFLKSYKQSPRGATILLRENTRILPDKEDKTEFIKAEEGSKDSITGEIAYLEVTDPVTELKLVKTCVTSNKQIVSEIVAGKLFQFSANEFFQNNNSILPMVTKYVQEKLGGESKYLVDAYCGSGLFTIMCSEGVQEVCGVEVSKDSVAYAKKNAALNNIKNATFLLGKAEKIFDDIKFPSSETSVICDPPRKGCDELFLTQLSKFEPRKIVYISCNVHSQARDLEFYINNTDNGSKYEIESVNGFDFFPQTHHVESVAVLRKKSLPVDEPSIE